MSSATATDTCNQASKLSRYRSVRRAAASIPEDVPAVPEQDASQLNRAPSRYRRANRQQRTQTVPLPTKPIPDPALIHTRSQLPPARSENLARRAIPPIHTAQLPASKSSPPHHNVDYKFGGGPVQNQQSPGAATPRHDRHLSRAASNVTRSPTVATPKSYEAAREEARMILEGEYDRIQKMKEMQRKLEQKTDSEAPDLKRRLTQKQQQSKPQPVYVDAPRLNVKMKVERSVPERYRDAPQSIGQKQQSPEWPSRSSKPQETKQESPTKSDALLDTPVPLVQKRVDAPVSSVQRRVEPPVSSVQRHFDAPKYDAPISAVNAGDRRVEVRLNKAARGITLPVTPTTNSKDLLNSASVVMSENFDPRTSILVESFSKVGLERPLRRYEHIRDVMNSWDSDDQNYFIIMSDSECQATGLELNEAPGVAPSRVMVQMHLSLRPGKWDKRWIILRSDGQVTMSKQENDGDGTNICHLSDFDVYTPTVKQRKRLKPPKKICFAVKSQQKSAMFLEGINFVHFFATNDKQVADRWYTAVRSWRSWYLVHVLGEGTQKAKASVATGGNLGTTERRPSTAQSTESVPYQLGSFKPLLDFSDLNFGALLDRPSLDAKLKDNSVTKKPSLDLGVGRPSVEVGVNEALRRGSRQRGLPPSSFPAKLFSDVESKGRTSLDNNDQAFTGGGLLGRNASTRRSQSGKSSGQSSTGTRGKPLVDLTPASDFAEGSLLRKLEAWSATHGEHDLKIDRQKRVEADVRVGEGLA